MTLGIIRVGQPGGGEIIAGKFVTMDGRGVYVYDKPVEYRLLHALGVNKAVLVAMHKYGYRDIHYTFQGRCLATTLAEVIKHGVEDPAQRRADHLYMPLALWHVIPRQRYPWISASELVRLPYSATAHTMTEMRATAVAQLAAEMAAKPRQMALGV